MSFLIVAISESFNEKISIPLMKTLPEVGLSRAPKIFINVVFPLPDGPTIDINSPFFTEKLTFLRDTTVDTWDLNTLEIFSTFKVIGFVLMYSESLPFIFFIIFVVLY